jgi:hypothetical protein
MNRLLAAMENPLERRLEDNLEVLAPRPSGAAPEKAVERPRRPKLKAQAAENVAEIDAAEQVLGGKACDAGAAARVVLGAFLRIAQNGVGLGDLPEAVGRVGRLVAVGMVLEGELAKRVLDRFLVGVPGDAQRFIVVARIGHGSPPFPLLGSALALHRMASRDGDARSRGSSSRLHLPRVNP